MWHPWRTLRDKPDVNVYWADYLPGGALGATNGRDIWLARGQLQTERRSTLTHELVHIEWDHHGPMPDRVERQVSAEAARRLIPIDELCAALLWARSLDEAADELWVDVATLATRLDTLDQSERRRLRRHLAARRDTA